MSSPKLRVAICGGGVAGLVCAVALSRHHDIEIDLYEGGDELVAPTGPGVGVWPRAWKILSALGLADALAKVAVVPPAELPKTSFTFRKGDQPQGVNFYTFHAPGLLAFQRPDFAAALLQHLSPHCRVRARRRLVAFHQTHIHGSGAQVALEFADGSRAVCDVLVGADGVDSAVRVGLAEGLARGEGGWEWSAARGYEDEEGEEGEEGEARDPGDVEREREEERERVRAAGRPRFSGTSVYRAMIPAEEVRAAVPNHPALEDPIVYVGRDAEITVYPVALGTYVSLTAHCADPALEGRAPAREAPWSADVPGAGLAREFSQFERWEPEVRALMEAALRVPQVNRWAVHTSPALPSLVCGNVVLLGDAAHATLPYVGSGPGQAIEDAYVLATLLGDRRTTRATTGRALRAYDAVRRAWGRRTAECASDNGLLCTLRYPGLAFDAGPVAPFPGARGEGDGSGEEGRSEDREKLEQIGSLVRTNWEWEWRTTVDVDVVKALRMLDDA